MGAGYRSHEAIWEGGASATPVIASAGYRSYESLWIGGASAFAPIVPPIPPVGNHKGGGTIIHIHQEIDPLRRKRKREDEEILFL